MIIDTTKMTAKDMAFLESYKDKETNDQERGFILDAICKVNDNPEFAEWEKIDIIDTLCTYARLAKLLIEYKPGE